MSDTEPRWTIRDVPAGDRRDANAAAARTGINIGQWISEAIRLKLAAERAPIGIVEAPEPEAAWVGTQLSVMSHFADWSRAAQFRASLRTGTAAGKVKRLEQQAFVRAYDQAVRALSDIAADKSDIGVSAIPADKSDTADQARMIAKPTVLPTPAVGPVDAVS